MPGISNDVRGARPGSALRELMRDGVALVHHQRRPGRLGCRRRAVARRRRDPEAPDRHGRPAPVSVAVPGTAHRSIVTGAAEAGGSPGHPGGGQRRARAAPWSALLELSARIAVPPSARAGSWRVVDDLSAGCPRSRTASGSAPSSAGCGPGPAPGRVAPGADVVAGRAGQRPRRASTSACEPTPCGWAGGAGSVTQPARSRWHNPWRPRSSSRRS